MTEKAVYSRRFNEKPSPLLDAFNASIGQDAFLWREEVQASKAYASALNRAGIFSDREMKQVCSGLKTVSRRIADGEDLSGFEDIHSAVELMLTEEIGEAGKKLHTGRSRNEQVATDERLWLKKQLALADEKLQTIEGCVLDLAQAYPEAVMPGYTHLQQGQPVLFSFYIMSLFWQMQRGRERLKDAMKRVDVLPLGSGALAGSSAALDREFLRETLGFAAISENAMDVVSDRSFIQETLMALGLILLDLSRFSEDAILFASREFGFLDLDDTVSTSSSLMPQKRNPDFYELIRSAPGKIFGQITQLFMTVKGLPSTYNKDLQNDKPALQSVEEALAVLDVFAELLGKYRIRPEIIEQKMDPAMLATDLADILTEQGVPFREAHGIAGEVIREAENRGCSLTDFTAAELKSFSDRFPDDVALPDFRQSLLKKRTSGSTHPGQVRVQMERARNEMARMKDKG